MPDEEYPNATITAWPEVFAEISAGRKIRRAGLVGGEVMPAAVHRQIRPGMTVCVDVSFFGHPELNGARIETGYEITEDGPVPMSPKMDEYLCEEIGR